MKHYAATITLIVIFTITFLFVYFNWDLVIKVPNLGTFCIIALLPSSLYLTWNQYLNDTKDYKLDSRFRD